MGAPIRYSSVASSSICVWSLTAALTSPTACDPGQSHPVPSQGGGHPGAAAGGGRERSRPDRSSSPATAGRSPSGASRQFGLTACRKWNGWGVYASAPTAAPPGEVDVVAVGGAQAGHVETRQPVSASRSLLPVVVGVPSRQEFDKLGNGLLAFADQVTSKKRPIGSGSL